MQGEAKVGTFLVMHTIKGATWHKNRQFLLKNLMIPIGYPPGITRKKLTQCNLENGMRPKVQASKHFIFQNALQVLLP
jgi:hypothetical protein